MLKDQPGVLINAYYNCTKEHRKEQYLKILAKNKHNISEVALQNECFDQVSSYINFQFNLKTE